MKKLFEDNYENFMEKVQKKPMTIDDLLDLVETMQKNEMDIHIGDVGQNGVGKTYFSLMVLKKYLLRKMPNPDIFENLFLAKHSTTDVIGYILNNEDTLIVLDEANQYLNYKKHSESEQNALISAFELARSKRIGVIANIRDPRKITLNYRQGKLSVVIWILDRYEKGGSYAAVCVANPSVETADKFGFMMLDSTITTMEELRIIFENYVPSFVTWMKIPNMRDILTKEEIEKYKHEKNKAMAYAELRRLIHEYGKRKIDEHDFQQGLKNLTILDDEEIENAILRAKKYRK